LREGLHRVLREPVPPDIEKIQGERPSGIECGGTGRRDERYNEDEPPHGANGTEDPSIQERQSHG
jgi:hypothetical protein